MKTTSGKDFKGITATKRELREGSYFHRAKIIVLNNLHRQKKGLPSVEEEAAMHGFVQTKTHSQDSRRTKNQTRRTHKHTWKLGKTYSIRASYFGKPEGHIKITKKFQQKLGEISSEDVKKEGFNSLEEFRRAWEEINGSWDPEKNVTVYEFELLKETWTSFEV